MGSWKGLLMQVDVEFVWMLICLGGGFVAFFKLLKCPWPEKSMSTCSGWSSLPAGSQNCGQRRWGAEACCRQHRPLPFSQHCRPASFSLLLSLILPTPHFLGDVWLSKGCTPPFTVWSRSFAHSPWTFYRNSSKIINMLLNFWTVDGHFHVQCRLKLPYSQIWIFCFYSLSQLKIMWA